MDTDTYYFKPEATMDNPVRRAVKIEAGKIYRARNGERVTVYAIHGEEIHGAIFHNNQWEVDTWFSNGKYLKDVKGLHDRDIILKPPLVITPHGKYRSRDGRPIEVFTINKDSREWPVIGIIKNKSGDWMPMVWDLNGVRKRPYGPGNDIVVEFSEG